jgi:GGDEF domain-containing protein
MLIAQLTLDYLAAAARKARELEHQACHDPLTGTPNRGDLQRDLALALDRRAIRSPGSRC